MDCFNKFFKYGFSGKNDAKRVQSFNSVQTGVYFKRGKIGVDEIPIIEKKLVDQIVESPTLSSFSKKKSTQA